MDHARIWDARWPVNPTPNARITAAAWLARLVNKKVLERKTSLDVTMNCTLERIPNGDVSGTRLCW